MTAELPSWTDYTVNVGTENIKYLERASAALDLRIMDLGDGRAALDVGSVQCLARQPEDTRSCRVTLSLEGHLLWIEGDSYELEPSFTTGVNAERSREADDALAWLEEGVAYGKQTGDQS
jgi:hypothetical protein